MPDVVFEVGPDQIIVVYSPPDTGAEIDVAAVFEAVAADAATVAATYAEKSGPLGLLIGNRPARLRALRPGPALALRSRPRTR